MSDLIFPITPKEAKKQGIEFSSDANKNAAFPTRLRELRKEAGVSQSELADILELSKSTVGLYETGDTLPDAYTLYKMAEYFRVNADYLLCLSNAKTEDVELQQVCDYTGLSEVAVIKLNLVNHFNAKFALNLADAIVSNEDLERANEYLVLAALSRIGLEKSKDKTKNDRAALLAAQVVANEDSDFDDGMIRIPAKDAVMWYSNKALDMVLPICQQTIIESIDEIVKKLSKAKGVDTK